MERLEDPEMPGQLASIGAGGRHLLWECPSWAAMRCLLVRMLTWFWCQRRGSAATSHEGEGGESSGANAVLGPERRWPAIRIDHREGGGPKR